jgi:hypothetical protein
MPLTIQHEVCPGHLTVTVCGQWDLEAAKREMERLRAVADELGIYRILVDVRDMSPQESHFSRYFTGENIARMFPYPFKLAVIDEPEYLNGFVETVVVNRGAFLAAFADEKSAMAWLLEKVPLLTRDEVIEKNSDVSPGEQT